MGRDVLVWSVGAADSGGGQGLPRVAHSGSGQGRASVPLCVREHVASSPVSSAETGPSYFTSELRTLSVSLSIVRGYGRAHSGRR